MTVHSFPRPILLEDEADPTCTLAFLRRQLGRREFGDGRMVTYLRKLVDQHGFPPPLPDMSIRKGLICDVTRNSRWIRKAVDAWLDDFLPPANGAAIDRAAQAAAAADMDAAAASLGNLRMINGGRA